jgi:hypothetical protein
MQASGSDRFHPHPPAPAGGAVSRSWIWAVAEIGASSQTAQLEAAKGGGVAGSCAAVLTEDSLWLCPIGDGRGLDSTCEGMMQGFSLGSYVQPCAFFEVGALILGQN